MDFFTNIITKILIFIGWIARVFLSFTTIVIVGVLIGFTFWPWLRHDAMKSIGLHEINNNQLVAIIVSRLLAVGIMLTLIFIIKALQKFAKSISNKQYFVKENLLALKSVLINTTFFIVFEIAANIVSTFVRSDSLSNLFFNSTADFFYGLRMKV